MTTYKEAKSAEFITDIIMFVEKLLGIRFWKTGKFSYSSDRPFHKDRHDSFRVYVNSEDVVRFHCFGCKKDCDIYELVEFKRKCGFHEAQQIFADFLGIEDFVFYKRGDSKATTSEGHVAEDDLINFIEPPEPDPKILAAMEDAGNFYNKFLLANEARFKKVFNYLKRRGVNHRIIQDYLIGYSPPYKDDNFAGRALIKHFLDRFCDDRHTFQPFYESGLVRLINGDPNFHRYVDFSAKDLFSGYYTDFFAGRIIFPIHDIEGRIQGIVGRRPDNIGTRWLKQQGAINAKSWLYGIDKARQAIQHYKTVIIVEGIFDYFAFYNLLQNTFKPIVVSTLGSMLTDKALRILNDLGVENYVIAFDWDEAGRYEIANARNKLETNIFYLGGMEDGQDPAEKLKNVVSAIDGFSLKHLMTAAKKAQNQAGKQINISYLTSGTPGKRNVIIKQDSEDDDLLPIPRELTDPNPDYYYNVDDFLPLLSYDNGNKAALEKKLIAVQKLLETKPANPESDICFTIPAKFISAEAYDDLEAALILWLWVAINQQLTKRRVVGYDRELAPLLKTSRPTFNKYKQQLINLGYLHIKQLKKGPGLSVRYFPKH